MTGEELRKTRQLWGMTQAEFADALGISDRAHVSHMEAGHRPVRETLDRLINVVQKQMDEMDKFFMDLGEASAKSADEAASKVFNKMHGGKDNG